MRTALVNDNGLFLLENGKVKYGFGWTVISPCDWRHCIWSWVVDGEVITSFN
jgi:hypothetical protein